MILADYTALIEVTQEMRKLRTCQECVKKVQGLPLSELMYFSAIGARECELCHGTGLNPDQTKWWEALANDKEPWKPWLFITEDSDSTFFCECPKETNGLWKRLGVDDESIIYRPSGDLRPWPEVLKELIEKQFMHDVVHADGINKTREWSSHDANIHFALATPESASIFKSFGIKTLVEA